MNALAVLGLAFMVALAGTVQAGVPTNSDRYSLSYVGEYEAMRAHPKSRYCQRWRQRVERFPRLSLPRECRRARRA